jgi:membrane protease YdiL (CAAX protease family)
LINGRRLAAPAAGSHIVLYVSIAALQLLFVWFVRLGIRARAGKLFDLVGTRWSKPADVVPDISLALLFVLALRVSSPLLRHLLGQASANTAFLLPTGFAESVLWIAVSITAGVCEELVYRGYLQRQLWALSGNLPSAIGLQAVIFAVGHAYQGWRPAVITGIYGLGFGFLAAWRKSIVPGAIAHALVDVIGGLFPR